MNYPKVDDLRASDATLHDFVKKVMIFLPLTLRRRICVDMADFVRIKETQPPLFLHLKNGFLISKFVVPGFWLGGAEL